MCALVSSDDGKQRWLQSAGVVQLLHRLTLGSQLDQVCDLCRVCFNRNSSSQSGSYTALIAEQGLPEYKDVGMLGVLIELSLLHIVLLSIRDWPHMFTLAFASWQSGFQLHPPLNNAGRRKSWNVTRYAAAVRQNACNDCWVWQRTGAAFAATNCLPLS